MEFVSWDDDIPNIWKIKTCSKPPTSQLFCDFNELEKTPCEDGYDGRWCYQALLTTFLGCGMNQFMANSGPTMRIALNRYTTSFSSTYSVVCKHLTNMSHFFSAKRKTLSSSEFVVQTKALTSSACSPSSESVWSFHTLSHSPKHHKVGNCETVKMQLLIN